MIEEVEIVKATVNDIPFILELYKQLGGVGNFTTDEAKKVFGKFQLYPDYSVYLAKIGERIVGTFELLIMDNLAHSGAPSGIVEDVVVDNEYRSQGIGRKMMEYAINCCREKHCYKLMLSSNIQRERAHRFYEGLGFKKHGYSFLIEL
jgi:GNAT superfamily N-acetyltransferase